MIQTSALFWRYLLSQLAVILPLIIFFAAAELWTAYVDANAKLGTLSKAEMRRVEAQVQSEFSRIEIQLLEVSKLPWNDFENISKVRREEMYRFLKLFPTVTDLDFASRKNGEVISVSRSRIDTQKSIEYNASEDWIDLSNSNRVQFGTQVFRAGMPFSQFAVVASDQSYFLGKLDLRFLGDIVKRIEYGVSGKIFIVDQNGRVLTHSDHRFANKLIENFHPKTYVAGEKWTSDRGEPSPLFKLNSLDGSKAVVTAMKMNPQSWWLVAELVEDEAYAPLYSSLKRSLAFLVLGLLLATLVSAWFARKFSAPIIKLSQSAAALDGLLLAVTPTPKTSNELQELEERFGSLTSSLKSIDETLVRRVQDKAKELETEFVTREAQGKEIVKLEERARIMRDFHDGVGGHLVGLLGAAKRDALDASQIEAMVNDALIDFRIAIDSLSPEETDLTTALAGLRFRLLPRLQAAGLDSAWSLEGLPEHLNFSREVIFHVQRILTEAITNVIKHAQATRVDVAAWVDSELGAMVLEVRDDGVGFAANSPKSGAARGRGVANISQRAALIGGAVEWRNLSNEGGQGAHGTVMRLQMPIALSGEKKAG